MTKISESKESICQLSINDIEPFIYNPYKVIDNEEMKELVENEIEDKEKTVLTIKEQKISCDNVYHFLAFYDIMYKNFTDAEKKQFLKQFLESVEIFKEQQPSGQILKSITFKFTVFYDGENITEICWDGITELETVALIIKNQSTKKWSESL